MFVTRQRIFWAAGLVVLALIIAGAYVNFVGTRTLLEHAEALAFRRMTVAQVGDEGEFRFFFVTNRTADSSEGPVRRRGATHHGSNRINFGLLQSGTRYKKRLALAFSETPKALGLSYVCWTIIALP